MLGWLSVDTGLARTPSDGLTDEMVSLLADEAEAFLRAGGRLSWGDWRGLPDQEREAFAIAGDRLRSEMAGMIGAAVSDVRVADAMMRGDDLEDAAAREYVDAGVRAIEERLGV